MRRPIRTTLSPLTLLLACSLPAALAQEADQDLLGGPSVIDDAEKGAPSIVERGFDGAMERPDGLPELTALEKLELDEASREPVEGVLAERNAMIDGILQDHLDLFGEALQAFRSGAGGGRMGQDRAAMGALMLRVREALAPVEERGTLREEIESALEGDDQATFRAMMDEFNQAEREAARARAPARGGDDRRVAFRRLLQEVGSSYDRVIGQRARDFDTMLMELDVDDETKGLIRAAFQGSLSENLEEGSREQRERNGRIIREVLDQLDPDQRRALIEELRRLRSERGQTPRSGG